MNVPEIIELNVWKENVMHILCLLKLFGIMVAQLSLKKDFVTFNFLFGFQ